MQTRKEGARQHVFDELDPRPGLRHGCPRAGAVVPVRLQAGNMTEDVREVCARREAECRLGSYAYNRRLKLFGYTSWITVVVPSLLGVTAGSALFATDNWAPLVGAAALVAGLLTAIHKGLDCDAYQAECRRLIQAYNGVATRYRTLHEVQTDSSFNHFLELEERLAELKEGATAKLPPGYEERVKEEMIG